MRPVRVGDQIAAAVSEVIADATGARVEIVDLADLRPPMLDEPAMPAIGNYQNAHTKAWAEIVSEADGIVFVTPQYNGGYPASLKNAIDYLFAEWRDKPALIVSYGGHGGGMSGARTLGARIHRGRPRRRQRRDHRSPRVVRRGRSPRRCPGDRPEVR